MPNAGGVTGGVTSGVTGGVTSGVTGGQTLTERQVEIYNLIKGEPAISQKRLAGKLKISLSASQKHFELLKEKGYIKRE